MTGCPSASCNNEQMNILNPASAQAGCQMPSPLPTNPQRLFSITRESSQSVAVPF